MVLRYMLCAVKGSDIFYVNLTKGDGQCENYLNTAKYRVKLTNMSWSQCFNSEL